MFHQTGTFKVMDEFIGVYDLPVSNPDEINNLNRSI